MSVLLIGYRGSGKTTLGRKLALELGWMFVDLDQLIVEATRMSIRDIFARHGEESFRQLETEKLLELLPLKNYVISLGGGAVLAEQNRQAIRASGHPVVYLRAKPEVLHDRIMADPATAAQRPGLTHLGGSIEEVRVLLSQREPLYQQMKSIELDVNTASTEDLVIQLRSLLSDR